MKFLISNVLSYRLTAKWWGLGKDKRKSILSALEQFTKEELHSDPGVMMAEMYTSLRYDSNLIFWFLFSDPKKLIPARATIEKCLYDYAVPSHGFLSVYESKLEAKPKRQDYFVAYPISKNVEWYLLEKGKRKEIMSEHIKLAMNDVNNNGITSYTTVSFGIDDNEFVVLYTIDSIPEWVHVTQNLRETMARKWISNEKPILVGYRGGFDAFLM